MTIDTQGAVANLGDLTTKLNSLALPPNALLNGTVPPYARRLAIIGDSLLSDINASPVHANHAGITDTIVPINGGLNGALTNSGLVLVIGAERNCPAGNGTLTATKSATQTTLTWQANGDTGPGTPVVFDRTKTVKIPSATAGYGLWATLRPTGANASNFASLANGVTTDTTVNVGASGNGYLPVVQVNATCPADWLRGDLHPTYTVIGKWAETGNWTANVSDQLADIIAAKPDEALILIGTNDIAGAASFSSYSSNVLTLVQGLLTAGIKVNVLSGMPRGDLNAAQGLRGLARYLEQFCGNTQNQRQMLKFIDCYSTVMSTTPGYTNATPYDIQTTYYNSDKLHPNIPGAMLLSSTIAGAMKDPGALPHYESETDLYDSTKNYYGNLVSNPQMLSGSSRPAGVPTGSLISTAGVNSGGTPTGTPPDDWTLSGAGLTYAHTFPTRVSVDATDTTRGNWWNINVTAGFGTQGFAYISIPVSNFIAGDMIEMGFDFSVDNPSLLTDFRGVLFFNGADQVTCGQRNGENWSAKGALTSALRRFWKSARWQVPTSWAWYGQAGTPSLCQLRIYFKCSAAVNLRLGNVFVRKVAP